MWGDEPAGVERWCSMFRWVQRTVFWVRVSRIRIRLFASPGRSPTFEEDRHEATWKRGFKLSWREAGPPNHLDDKVDSDKQVVNEELSLSTLGRPCSVFPGVQGPWLKVRLSELFCVRKSLCENLKSLLIQNCSLIPESSLCFASLLADSLPTALRGKIYRLF